MTRFYVVSHNTAHSQGMPEIDKIVDGIIDDGECRTCRGPRRRPAGDLLVRLGKKPDGPWPDAMACGDYPAFVAAKRFVEAMRASGIQLVLGGQVSFANINNGHRSSRDRPTYFWIDGERHLAGNMDFEASGFVNVRFCPECGSRTEDIAATYRRRRSKPAAPFVFVYDDASGLDLFTTDLAPTLFFCNDKVLNCARTNRLINLRFSRVEDGVLGEAIDY